MEAGTAWILGRVIEVVSERRYRDYIATNILEPVGMDDSFVADGEVHESIATGHTPWFGGKRTISPGPTDLLTAPQGGILATGHDLGLYMIMMMNGEDDVLSVEGKELMLRGADAASPWYGFGWYLDSDDGSAWHGGTSPGVETLLVMVPGEQRGAVALANAGSGLGFGETGALLNGLTSHGVGLEYSSGPSWPRKALFVSLALLPIFYVLSMAWAWRFRTAIRAKSGVGGLFSWWFPLLATAASAWVFVWLVPRLFGAPLGTIREFSPDFHLILVASAVTGIVWAVFRLGVVYGDRSGRSPACPHGWR
jgi:CubicO group peptidase (beta-lactamase class C family)